MKISFIGDLFLGGDLIKEDIRNAVDSKLFYDADIKIGNLEQAISDSFCIEDKGTLYTDSQAVDNLIKIDIKAVNLANNHIHDKTAAGILETIKHLDEAGIGHFGAGANILEAGKPYWLNGGLCIIGYCEFGRSYLRRISVATDLEPGVNPLRYNQIIHDLDKLPVSSQAILMFHWGREHVGLPPAQDIKLAKELLDDPRVALIIGMHAHRIQGYIEHNNKRAYMCLGNFLFPNFFIEPPTQISYLQDIPSQYDITRQYHSVSRLTYKKWRLKNRISLIVNFNTETGEIIHQPVVQEDYYPRIMGLNNFPKKIIYCWINWMSLLYKLPKPGYCLLERINNMIVYFFWRVGIVKFQTRQNGLKWLFRELMERTRRRKN